MATTSSQHDAVREKVSRAYARAVTRGTGDCSCSEPAPKGSLAQVAGYTTEELQALPPEAVANSFGCGNPTAFSKVHEGDVVLDLGSGAGIDILLAGKRVGATGRAIGIDMTDEMLAQAKENIAASGLGNVEVRKGVIEDLPVESGSVDWVISNCVINLSPDKARVFGEIARVLKPGGRMLVSDIVVDDLPAWTRGSDALYSSCVAGAISESQYVDGLRAAGLEDVEARGHIRYEASQLEGFIKSESAAAGGASPTCRAGDTPKSLADAAAELAGKVASVMFYARKPA